VSLAVFKLFLALLARAHQRGLERSLADRAVLGDEGFRRLRFGWLLSGLSGIGHLLLLPACFRGAAQIVPDSVEFVANLIDPFRTSQN
jgi:hypothetical protein